MPRLDFKDCRQRTYSDRGRFHQDRDYALARSRAKLYGRVDTHRYDLRDLADLIAPKLRSRKPKSDASLLQEAEGLRPEFNALAEQWRRETKFSSSLDDKILHSAYQSIIAMGHSAVPLVLEELESRRGHWSWALHFMTGIDPVPEGANVDAARDAWLKWGRQEGYLAQQNGDHP